MSREHAEIARRMYDAWNADDFAAAEQMIHPDVEWETSGQFPGFDPVYHGPAGVHRFWVAMKEVWAYFTITIESTALERPDVVVLAVRFRGAGRESGVETELTYAHAWRVEDGQVVRYRAAPSLGEAIAAADRWLEARPLLSGGPG